MKVTEPMAYRIRWGVFLAAFALGMLYVYVTEPAFQVMLKYPTPYDRNIIYHDLGGGCYTYVAKEVPCTKDAVVQPVPA